MTIRYWDYFDPEQQVLPILMSYDPNTNPLYLKERCAEINKGEALPKEMLNHHLALGSQFFSVNKMMYSNHACLSFGGKKTIGNTREENFDSNDPGILEQMPHNKVHLFIGGPNGFMSDNCQLSRDPKFWVHHVQIDRIWESWLKKNRDYVYDSKWLNHNFTWFNETGAKVNRSIKEFLDIEKQLNYTYDDYIERELELFSKKKYITNLKQTVDEKKSQKNC